MASEKIPYGSPSAPAMDYYAPHPITYPPGTCPPLPLQYGTPSTVLQPCQYDTSGSVPYGFNCPPPPYSAAPSPGYSVAPSPGYSVAPSPGYSAAPSPGYSAAPSPGYSAAPSPGYSVAPSPGYSAAPSPGYSAAPSPSYSAAPSPGYSVASSPGYSAAPASGYYHGYPAAGPSIPPPPMPAEGQTLYPDLSQVSDPSAATCNGSKSPLSPCRPAPLPPGQAPISPPASGPADQKYSFGYLKEGEAPPGYVVQWRGGDGLQIFFIQRESHIVSPKKPLIMSIYKQIGVPGSVEGMVEVHGVWRLRFTGKTTPALHTITDCYTFLDTSTCPSRVVVIQMSSQLTKKMSVDLHDLLTDLTDLREEDGGMVEKVTSGVATVYDDATKKLNTVVKETVPGAHKNTKWLRKNTGSLVRIGGSLVAKGIHLVADHIPANEKHQEESAVHTELLSALTKYKKGLEENSITFIY